MPINPSALLLGFVISSLIGAAFHLLRGGGLSRLLLYLVLGWIGFWAGQFLAVQFDWRFFSVGALRLGAAVLSSLAILVLGSWLSPAPKSARRP